MILRVSVSSNTSSFDSGGSPIHSIDCVNHGFGGFSTYRIAYTLDRKLSGCHHHQRFDRAEEYEHLRSLNVAAFDQTNIVVRNLCDLPPVNAGRHRLDVYDFPFITSKEILGMLSFHIV